MGRKTQPASDQESRKVVWYCDKCKQKHIDEPEQCKVCGTEEFERAGGKSAKPEEVHQYTRPDDDAETISNVREATSSPVQPESDDNNLGLYAWFLLLVIFVALIFYLL
ncbi:hypothetical protein EGH21_21495 [Halomicroarcula sp. F13]|uniref:RanBP2-type domain-containing protein n=1 Tax=Haloarcula rubra TaxID=2487747 RepID=A0AAW4PW97_9EURY|nr:hypothetical protein [Halomicroarcula rubra]MBX0325601.1 hypothetical protein [Halomicroarcula rubra]